MFILYVLECMLLLFLEGGSPGGSASAMTLVTTKQPMTISDVVVGYFGWVVLAILIFGILLLIKYLQNRDTIKKYKRECEEKGSTYRRKVFTAEDIKSWAILFGISLFVLVIGIVFCALAKDGTTFSYISQLIFDIGLMITTSGILIPIFRYLWRKLDV